MNPAPSRERTALVVGATGATGRLLLRQLVDRGFRVRAIARAPEKLPGDLRTHPQVQVITGNVLGLTDSDLATTVAGCHAVVSCLGHNMSFKGIFGPPRRLVAETVRRLCLAIEANGSAETVRLVLMTSAGVSNQDAHEKLPFKERAVLFLIRHMVPPHADNERAADCLRIRPKADTAIQWVVVRPDTLINEAEVGPYEIHASPTRSAIFDPGKTSRINVAHFIADLIDRDAVWSEWQGQMPVIYNSVSAVPPG